MSFGPTGEFPSGKLNENDEGELVFGVAADHEHKLVVLTFGSEVRWLAMPAEAARQMALSLVRAAGEVDGAQ